MARYTKPQSVLVLQPFRPVEGPTGWRTKTAMGIARATVWRDWVSRGVVRGDLCGGQARRDGGLETAGAPAL